MTIYVSYDLDVSDIVMQCGITDRWALLQLLWKDLRVNGRKADWESFYRDNAIEETGE